MVTTPRETDVLRAIVTLVDSLLDDFDVVELLTDLTEQSTQLLDVGSAGLLLADRRQNLHLMAATSKKTHDLELFQLQADDGPCLDCFSTGEAVSAPDLNDEEGRWPCFVPAATAAGFASVHAVPMRAAGTVVGALGLFGTQVGALNEADLLVAHTLAHVACVAILQRHPPTSQTVGPPFQAALDDRVVVDQAIGFTAERLGVPTSDAFDMLRRYARTHAQHLTPTARQVIANTERDDILAALTRLPSPT